MVPFCFPGIVNILFDAHYPITFGLSQRYDIICLIRKIMKRSNKKALIIAPHQDDEVIGCGGTMVFLKEKKFDVGVIHVFLGSSGVKGVYGKDSHIARNKEASSSAQVLGYQLLTNLGFEDRKTTDYTQIQLKLMKHIREYKPNLIFIPHKDEQDAEHKLVYKAGWEASWLAATSSFPEQGKPIKRAAGIFLYEVWTPIQEPSLYVDTTPYEKKKKKALKRFKTQMKETLWANGSLGLSSFRGTALQGSGLAEAFLLKGADFSELMSLFKK